VIERKVGEKDSDCYIVVKEITYIYIFLKIEVD